MKGPGKYEREKKADAQTRSAKRIRRAEIKRRAMERRLAAWVEPPYNGHDQDPPRRPRRRTPPNP